MRFEDRTGFTIIELLIVIVVIAILAAISVVAYNGIQARASVSETASFANMAVKTLQAYKAAEGQYPQISGCIGNGYIDRTGDGSQDCRWNYNGSVWTVSTSLNNLLDKYVQKRSAPDFYALIPGSGYIGLQGATYYYNPAATLDGNPQHDWIVYAVNGDTCPVGPFYERVNWPHMVTNSSVTRSYAFEDDSACWITLR